MLDMPMRVLFRLRGLLPLLLLMSAGVAQAQSFDLDKGREPVVSLDGQWRFHPGDSPYSSGVFFWAAPGFDDSSWPLLQSSKSWSEQGYPNMGGFGWYRFSVHVPAGEAP